MNLDSNSKYKSKKRSFFEYIKRMRMMELLEKDILKRRWKKYENCDTAWIKGRGIKYSSSYNKARKARITVRSDSGPDSWGVHNRKKYWPVKENLIRRLKYIKLCTMNTGTIIPSSLKEKIFWYTLGAIGVTMVGMSIWGLTRIPWILPLRSSLI